MGDSGHLRPVVLRLQGNAVDSGSIGLQHQFSFKSVQKYNYLLGTSVHCRPTAHTLVEVLLYTH